MDVRVAELHKLQSEASSAILAFAAFLAVLGAIVLHLSTHLNHGSVGFYERCFKMRHSSLNSGGSTSRLSSPAAADHSRLARYHGTSLKVLSAAVRAAQRGSDSR